MDNLLTGLNEAQKAAVTSISPVLQVLAPPGSGKTKTLTARAAFLIAQHGLSPWNMVVCTFTIKAAKEMRERICNFVGEEVARKLVLGTFHSVARRYLSQHGCLIGLDAKFGIADASDTKSILTRIIKKLGAGFPPGEARSRISNLKSRGLDAQGYTATHRKAEEQEFARVFSDYEEHLQVNKLLDFDDLLLKCVELLRRYPTCVASVEAVLIDEFQDTNNVQFDLMQLLAQRRNVITIVGDPDQSIYGWRSAEIKNLTKMRESYPDTHVINLEENYRSSGSILIAAQEVIEQDESRPPKRLMPTHSVGLRPVLRTVPTAEDEASWIVAEITRTTTLAAGLFDWSEYAILLRSATLSRLIEQALARQGIPYKMIGGHRFFDRLEVKLVLDYLRVIDHPDHDDALARVMNVPLRKIGDTTIQNLLTDASARKVSLWQHATDILKGNTKPTVEVKSQQLKGLASFMRLISGFQRKLRAEDNGPASLSEFIGHVVEKSCLMKHLKEKSKHTDEFTTRKENVDELIAHAQDALSEEEQLVNADDQNNVEQGSTLEKSLARFLANVALSAEPQKTSEDGKSTAQVTLSTMHAAKGLEWPVVFCPAVYEGSIPHSRADDQDEERRLLYVAMTRAQCLLYISHPLKDSRSAYTAPSKFLSSLSSGTYFDDRGSRLGFSEINEVATILRRETPSADIIELAVQGSKQSLEDKADWEKTEAVSNVCVTERQTQELGFGSLRSFGARHQSTSTEHTHAYRAYQAGQRHGRTNVTTMEQHASRTAAGTTTIGFVAASTTLSVPFHKLERKRAVEGVQVSEHNTHHDTSPPKKKRASNAVATSQMRLDSFMRKTSDSVKTTAAIATESTTSIQAGPSHEFRHGNALHSVPLSDVTNHASGNASTAMVRLLPSTTSTNVTGSLPAVDHQTANQKKTYGVRRSVDGGWLARMKREGVGKK